MLLSMPSFSLGVMKMAAFFDVEAAALFEQLFLKYDKCECTLLYKLFESNGNDEGQNFDIFTPSGLKLGWQI